MVSHIATLGSSFAAGPSIQPVASATALRSAANYSALLARQLGAHHTDLSVSGAVIANMVDTPQRTRAGFTFAPQIQGLPADADLVFISCGGNDLGFSRPMISRALGYVTAFRVPGPEKIERVGTDLARAVEAARRVGGARVVLVDYLPVLDDDPSHWLPWFSESEGETLLEIQEGVVEVNEIAAGLSGADLVQASVLGGHELNTDDAWISGLLAGKDMPGSFHPNARGMQEVARCILDSLPLSCPSNH